MELTKGFVMSCRNVGFLRDALCQAIDQVDDKDKEIESLKASHYAEMVDAGMTERRLRRALWLAREWRAWCEGQFWFIMDSDTPRDVFHLFCTQRIHRTPTEWMTYWQNVERKCRAKAEEYK